MGRTGKIISYSFLIIAAIHIAAFSVVGIISGDWSLLVIFAAVFAAIVLAKFIISKYNANKNKPL